MALLQPAAACSPEALQQALDDTRRAYLAEDLDALRAADASVLDSLGCLDEPLRAAQVRELYQAAALNALTQQPRDEDEIRKLLVGLLAVAPEAPLAETGVQPGSLLPELLDQAREEPASALAEPRLPADCCAAFDGVLDAARPLERPVVLQLLSEDGAVLYSGWLPPGAPIPTESCPPPPAAVVITELPAPPPREPLAQRGRRLVVGGSVGLLASGGLALGARWFQQQHAALDEQPSALGTDALTAEEERLRRSGNTLSVLALGGGAASAAAVGVGATLLW